MIMGTHAVVSSGHYLATEAGMSILRRGGNAFDAAAAVGFALTVTQPHQNGIGGEVPMLVYSAREKKVHALSGHGVAPKAATLEHFRSLGIRLIPGDGLLPAVVPCAPATWMLLLERFGTMRLADVMAPAIALAENGFPMYDALRNAIAGNAARFKSEWPTSAEVFTPRGRVPGCGEVWRQPLWAATFKRIAKAESRHKNRKLGFAAARDAFYRGFVAKRIAEFCRANSFRDASGKSHAGLLTLADFDAYEAKVEPAPSTTWRGLKIHKCPTWTQGPVLLQSLNLVENFDLAAMRHNSAAYIHTVTECMKLAYADREFHYGDMDFVKVPLARLLSKEYAKERATLIDAARASMDLRPGGLPAIHAPKDVLGVNECFGKPSGPGDTTKLEVIDSAGNMISATPSGGWLQSSPVVEGLGFPLGTRGQMFSLVEGHPNRLEPGKRPRTTLTPSLATKGGRPFMVFGSPGGDAQDQWALQFILNVTVFGMSLQEAVEAPTFWSAHWPSSFYPRTAEPGALNVESRIPEGVRAALSSLGHDVRTAAAFAGGNTLAAHIDLKSGVKCAAASPRLDPAYAAGW
jgi:gamma-glutamyltranspeptidase/glutathione hydrolase